MAEEKAKKLMTEFPPVTTGQWEEVIAADLKGADRTKKLVWRTMEGFPVEPYYRAENMPDLAHLAVTKAGEFPYVRGVKADNNWRIRQTVRVGADLNAANAAAHQMLMSGVDSLGFAISNGKEFTAQQLDELLAGISLPAIEVAFEGCGIPHVANLFLDKVVKENLDPEAVYATFNIDPLGNASKKGSAPCPNSTEKIKKLITKAPQYKRIRFVGVGGTLFHDCGASIVQELAFTLAMGHEYIVRLMDAGLDIDQAAPALKFNVSVGTNYFMEIAKIRAGRMLWANITSAYEPKRGCASKMRVHVETSAWNQTVYDPYVNMLRGTTETMSAALSGVDSIEVTPFDAAYEKPTEFSERIARNVQHLLKEESHFEQVTDPAAGSYYIEELTASIAKGAWDLFKQVEEKGGYVAAFEAGFIQEQVAATALKRDQNIATRREILLGTNQYPNFTEKADLTVVKPETVTRGGAACGCGCGSKDEAPAYTPLTPYRGGMAFEEMRLKTDRSGKNPRAFMLTCGNLSMARARSQFASNFFACAGIEVIDNTYFPTVAEGVVAAKESGAEIVVVCAADDDYATAAPEVHNAIGESAIVVVAGAPASQPELEAAGITHFISVKSNVLETLKQYQSELGIN